MALFGGNFAESAFSETRKEQSGRWQHRLDPLWSRLANGCQLNRHTPTVLGEGGFRVIDRWEGTIPDLRVARCNYRGQAVPQAG